MSKIEPQLEAIATEFGYDRLSPAEAKASNATHQHKSMRSERYALTLLLGGNNWTHRDDRGDDHDGTGPEALRTLLQEFADEMAEDAAADAAYGE